MSKKPLILCTVLLAVNVLFIWGNSMLPREVSAAFSAMVSRILNFLFPGTDIPVTGEGHGILRKLAHFTEFCSLGLLLCWEFSMLCRKKAGFLWKPLLCGVLAACVDETIQLFVPGRGPAVLDVMIDSAGVFLGVGIWYLILALRKNKKKPHKTTKNAM